MLSQSTPSSQSSMCSQPWIVSESILLGLMEAPQSFLAQEPRMSALAEWHFLFRKLGPNSMEVYLPDSLDLMC